MIDQDGESLILAFMYSKQAEIDVGDTEDIFKYLIRL